MNPLNKAFLEEQRFHYDRMVTSGVLKGLDYHTRNEMARVMSEEFAPGYVAPNDCGPCIFDMVKLLYERYEAWKAGQVSPLKILLEESGTIDKIIKPNKKK